MSIVEFKAWPLLMDTDDLSKKKLQAVYRAPTPEMLCYLDFSVSTTGMLAGIKVGLYGDVSCLNYHLQSYNEVTILQTKYEINE